MVSAWKETLELESGTAKEYRKKAVNDLHEAIIKGKEAEDALWQAIIAWQEYPLYTSSGLPFQYTVKRKRNGDYSGELVINRKEDSKTLTRSSVMYAFHKVEKQMLVETVTKEDGSSYCVLAPPEYKGRKQSDRSLEFHMYTVCSGGLG